MQKRWAETSGRELSGLVGIFRLLSDTTRLNILLLLAGGERDVTSICESLVQPQPTISHHLGLLRMQNLISNRRDGKQVFYCLNEHVVPHDGSGLQIAAQGFNVKIAKRE
jgi:DNA-binding transcriptional ArsR family regulator